LIKIKVMSKKEKGPVTKTWLEARQLLADNNLEEAELTLDKGIFLLGYYSMQGLGDKDLLEDVKMETWKERFWVAIQNNIWPTREDYEEVWKCQ